MKPSLEPELLLPLQGPPPVYLYQQPRQRRTSLRLFVYVVLSQLAFWLIYTHQFVSPIPSQRFAAVIHPGVLANRANLTERCKTLRAPAGPPPSFDPASRLKNNGRSDRFAPGTPPVLIRNAKVWTGRNDGKEIIEGDVLLNRGLIVDVGDIPKKEWEKLKGLKEVDAEGRWVTPGLVDLHSHTGVDSAPHLEGSSDTNSRKAPILPWIRSVDGINTHDAAYETTVAGGVTTAQILPGSAGNIGGQAFVIKLRPTAEKTTSSKLLEPPETLIRPSENVTHINWRHMKHACGENPDRVYNEVRMDAAWEFRQAYNTARDIKNAQDTFCDAVEAEDWDTVGSGDIPVDFQWEALVDVLRGKVRLSIHCYEAVDLDVIVRLSNEFQFPVASFHHAAETYLVPDLLKQTFGGAPTIALFATNWRKKREMYRGSEFAPRILASHNISVVMKSDHPVLNERYLLFEAQQAHYYGLSPELALSSVTTRSARAAGLGHRVGFISKGYDADVVIWDSHPLVLGATPTQVFIDGIAQLHDPEVLSKPKFLQRVPKTPNFDKEARETVEFDGLPPLRFKRRHHKDDKVIKFTNVSYIWTTTDTDNSDNHNELDKSKVQDVYVKNGAIVCITSFGVGTPCRSNNFVSTHEDIEEIVDLEGGSFLPGLVSFGSPLGLDEIAQEPSTNDGSVPDALTGSVPSIVGGDSAVIRAVDGIVFNGRNLLLAYRNGVTKAITAPSGGGFLQGLSTEFFTGAENILDQHAVLKEEVALHVTISHDVDRSISTQISTLRELLFHSETPAWKRVREREIPLVVRVDSADFMSTLLRLKNEFKNTIGGDFDLTFAGGSEAHLVAKEIARANVSVIVTMPRPFPGSWESQRILPGAPLTHQNTVMKLLEEGVNVGIGVVDTNVARNTRFEAAWLALNSFGEISIRKALALITVNLERALGIRRQDDHDHAQNVADWVAYRGGNWMDFESKVVGVVSSEAGVTDLF